MGKDLMWKELQIDNLPPDILTGDYEFVVYGDKWVSSGLDNIIDILTLVNKGKQYRYRKPEPKQPTHDEIMTKWWRWGSTWHRILAYQPNQPSGYTIICGDDVNHMDKFWFIGRESAEIPPIGE